MAIRTPEEEIEHRVDTEGISYYLARGEAEAKPAVQQLSDHEQVVEDYMNSLAKAPYPSVVRKVASGADLVRGVARKELSADEATSVLSAKTRRMGELVVPNAVEPADESRPAEPAWSPSDILHQSSTGSREYDYQERAAGEYLDRRND